MERISRERFIRLSTALGVGAAAASLAACGGGAGSGGSASSGGDSGGDSGGGKPKDRDHGGGKSEGHDHGNGKPKDHDHGGEKSGGGGKEDSPKQAASSSGGAAIASESEVAPGSAVTFKDAGNPAVLVHLDNGDFVAYSAVCTHQGCTVAYQDGQLACPCHGSLFDPAAGAAVITGPASSPLPEIPVKVEGGDVVKA